MSLLCFSLFILSMLMTLVSAWNWDFNNDIFIGKHKVSFWKTSTYVFGILIVVFFSLFIYFVSKDKELKVSEKIQEETAWVTAQCPVYKSECGSKHKYSCEQKAATVGRNRVGEIFVEAYATCGAK